MYKLQAFCMLIFTLLAFSQESPVPKTNNLLAAQKEVELLKKIKEVMEVQNKFLVPTDVQGNCTVNALDCFTNILDWLQLRIKKASNVTNTISHAMANLEQAMGLNSQKRNEKKLCYNTECIFSMQKRTIVQALDDLTTLLKQMYNMQQ